MSPNRDLANSVTLNSLRKSLPALKTWLSAAGAEVLEPTNEWEVVRFRSNGDTSIVYTNKGGKLTFTGEAGIAVSAFKGAKGWRANERTKRRKVSPNISTLRKRDGDRCFFCGIVVGDDASVDHLVPLAHGGPNHISNFVLMHQLCNMNCGHMSATEKIRAHVEWQKA